MRRVLLILMCTGLISMAQALSVTNGNFEIANPTGVDINDNTVENWYSKTSGGFWQGTWQSNANWITDPSNHLVVFSGENIFGQPSPDVNVGGYLYQSIGTAGGLSSLLVRFDWGAPGDDPGDRELGMTVGVYAYDGVSGFVAGNDVDVLGGAGVTLLDSASYTMTTVGGGQIDSILASLDISDAGSHELFLRFNNYAPTAPAGDGGVWPVLDNISIANIENNSPANDAALIPVVRTETENDLVFTINDPNISDVEVYLSANDPNVPDLIKTINSVGTGQKTVTLEAELASDLSFDTDYYWQVIGYEPNSVSGLNDIVVPGSVWHFTTAPETPLITVDPPAYTLVDAGEPSIELVAGGINGDLQWYKDGSPITDVAGAYAGTATNTLTIYDVQLADEGYYTLKVTNLIGEAKSTPARIMIRRQTSYYDFESTSVVDGNEVFVDSIDGYYAVLMQDSASAGLPTVSDANQTELSPGLPGSYGVLIDNDDADPNNQYLQIYPGVCAYEDITISLWVYPKSVAVWARLFDFGNGESSYMFLTPDIGGYDVRFAIGGAGDEQLLTGDLNSQNWIAPGAWHYVAITVSGDTGRMYVDGVLRATNTGMTRNPIDVDAVLNYIGKSQYATDPYFNGLIDELKIYNYALTTEEIAQEYLTYADPAGYVCNLELEALPYDYNNNCQVDLPDLAIFAGSWLENNRITLP